MAGYSENREQNLEMKYLRKVLIQVDKRIQVPEAISGDRLRALIDDVESATPRDIASRRKRLTLRSAIAYAAAFMLIIGMFYGLRMNRPEMISGGMQIMQQASVAEHEAEQMPDTRASFDAGAETGAPSASAAGEAFAEPSAAQAEMEGGEAVSDSYGADNLGVGGLLSTLLLEQDGYAYYARQNDENDPDKLGYPVTIDIVNTETNLIEAQIDVDNMLTVESISVLDGQITVTGLYGNHMILNVYEYDGYGGYYLSLGSSGTPTLDKES
ncbi:MAG: hypothetical protein FWG94_13310 [Oscillospiraceae bacterium]|nr:hypothetical protein [Oscillospiraceae bacterium]